jgi:hypothetical protein
MFVYAGGNMKKTVPRTESLRGAARGDESTLAGISESDVCQQFDGIDWSAAAPPWGSIFTGVILPALAIVALTIFIDYVLCWLLITLIDHSWGLAPWLLSAMVFPMAAICAFSCGKLLLYLNGRVLNR